MRFAVEAWAPEYGASLESADDQAPTAQVNETFERALGDWDVIAPAIDPPHEVAFVDGTNRVDAQVWIDDGGPSPAPGLCATYAAGVARCNEVARVADVQIGRNLFAGSGDAVAIETRHGAYPVVHHAGDIEQLSQAVMSRMRDLEAVVARTVGDLALIILDGLLWGRTDIPNAVGYVKSHRTRYLPDDAEAVIARLTPGERTPLFLITTKWSRVSWYLRLPGGAGHPWAGIVRCEASPELDRAAAAHLADLTCVALPRFASARHRDRRAPQNLYPIAGIERELRRRMGDPALLHRALRAAARA